MSCVWALNHKGPSQEYFMYLLRRKEICLLTAFFVPSDFVKFGLSKCSMCPFISSLSLYLSIHQGNNGGVIHFHVSYSLSNSSSMTQSWSYLLSHSNSISDEAHSLSAPLISSDRNTLIRLTSFQYFCCGGTSNKVSSIPINVHVHQ